VNPYHLIGKPYRLGARIDQHGATDCVGLCIEVMEHYGFPPPKPKRSWYRRLRKGDNSIFWEQLERWGEQTKSPRLGCIALCQSENGYGLAVWFENGWLSFVGSAVQWSTIDALQVVGCYYPQR
jgi:hypothetical protein